jgi:hypothetical protein
MLIFGPLSHNAEQQPSINLLKLCNEFNKPGIESTLNIIYYILFITYDILFIQYI